ncbi:MAG: hypothetical protein ABI614_06190 [Planctomycetota bacterium]
MKRKHRHRRLAYEQLESKSAPSSILMVVPGDSPDSGSVVATSSIATRVSLTHSCPGEADQILRFVAEHTTGGERAQRTATLPTSVQCAAADEMMMRLEPVEWNSLLVVSFYDDGTEL